MKRKRMRLPTRPRISIFRSNKFIYAQIIDDIKQVTLASAHDRELHSDKTDKKDQSHTMTHAYQVGEQLAQKAKKAGITKVRFDRGRYKYHGRVKALAEGARAGGLEF